MEEVPISNPRILVVEDDYLAAEELTVQLRSLGLEVLGPVARVEHANALIEMEDQIGAAILDVNLGDEMVFPVADELARRSIPFVFATAYEPDVIPRRHQDRQLVRKPFDTETIRIALKEAGINRNAAGSDIAQNALLSCLSASEQAEILPFMKKVELPRGAILEQPAFKISHAYFPISCIASVIIRGETGVSLETGIIGREGMTAFGIHACDPYATFEVVNQVEGEALKIELDHVERFFSKNANFRSLTSIFARTFNIQTSYTALANGRFTVTQRLARWLLMIDDRLDRPSFTITHEYLSVMLGVRRASITDSLHLLEGERLIRSTRSLVQVTDRAGLMAATGGCYGVPEAEHHRLFRQFADATAVKLASTAR